jgi:aryl-alcohol dehydrogenase-like predicted oxidoreductase
LLITAEQCACSTPFRKPRRTTNHWKNPAALFNISGMDLTRTAYGIWSGGRFMNFGEPLDDDRFLAVVRHAYDRGIRTFMTADVYGSGQADEMLRKGLAGLPRDSYCLVGAIGHDFYKGKREGAKGFPRFTNPALRAPAEFADYIKVATEKSLERCGVSKFDLLLLHNPDSTGYSSEAVWRGLEAVQKSGLTERLGVAPGERFHFGHHPLLRKIR